jgi:RimJ/RimL family protein N-acetyltransferase
MLGSLLSKARFAVLLLRVGGPIPVLLQLKRQLYSRGTFLGLEKYLELDGIRIPCGVEYTLSLASDDDMNEILERAKHESRQSAHELVQRKWFYDAGFRNCYVARAVDTGEPCYIQWMISLADGEVLARRFAKRFPKLEEHEVLLENAYTFEKYRGKRLMPSVELRLAEVAREKGFKRMITYVLDDNVASLKGCERAGFKVFEQVPVFKLLFFGGRKHS